MLGMGNMRQWLMNISLVGGWFPAAAFAVVAVLCVTLLVSAGRFETGRTHTGYRAADRRCGRVRNDRLCGSLAAVRRVRGVRRRIGIPCDGLGGGWFRHRWFRHRAYRVEQGMMCVAAAILTVFAILAAAIGIDQSYGEYATIGSLFGEDSYSQADLTGLAKRKDLITVAQWRKQAANGTIRNIPANGTVNKIDIPATKSQFEARKALVYLPPAALADSKRKPALPVVLMLSGQPGSPGRVFQAGGIQTMMDGYAKTHDGLAPIVIAADQLGADSHNTLCVDSKVYGNALTYLTQDVVDWVKTNLPAAQDAKDWAIAGFSQGATCSLQIGVNHPDLFGTMIPTDSEIKPTNGSRQEMIDRFFDGDTTAYENQVPVNAIRNHAPTHQMLIIGAGEKDTTSIRNVKTIAPVAAKAGHARRRRRIVRQRTRLARRAGRAALRARRIRPRHRTGWCEPEPIRLSESQTHHDMTILNTNPQA